MPTDPTDDAHVLIPPALATDLPPLYATIHESDSLARVKFFTPDSSFTWFVVEFDPKERLCFGLAICHKPEICHEREFVYFSLYELETIRGPLGLKIERDLYFEPKPVSQCN